MSVIPKIPRALGGFGLPGLYPGPAGELKRPPDPSHTHAPLTTNPGSAPVTTSHGHCSEETLYKGHEKKLKKFTIYFETKLKK